jgi:transposase-like protein
MDEDRSSKWASVAADYIGGDLTVAQICERYGISQKALYEQVKDQGWPLRSAGGQSSREVRQRRRGAKTARKTLIARLYRALEQKMSEFESRQPDGVQTAADHERDTRTLNTMVRLFERLSALDEKGRDKKASAGSDAGMGVTTDARAVREDLARRLERLRADHGA